jgi:hypothetical protein
MQNSKLNFRTAMGVYHWRGAYNYADAPDRAMRLPLASYHADFQYVGLINGVRSEDNAALTALVKEINQEICDQTPETTFYMNKH